MIIFPAIDIMDGKPVRLLRGDFATAEQVAEDVLTTAKQFARVGCTWVHMVDLDGSLQKKPVNADPILQVVEHTPLKVEVGGGIRTMEDIAFYLDRGVDRVILGSVALKNPELVQQAVDAYGDKIAVGIDAKHGMVATEAGLRTPKWTLSNWQRPWRRWALHHYLYGYWSGRYPQRPGCARAGSVEQGGGLQCDRQRRRYHHYGYFGNEG